MGKSPTSDALDAFAKTVGGFRTYDFSQAQAFKVIETDDPSQGKMYKMVLRNGQPMGGVCMTMCAFWVVFHAMQDKKGGNPFTKGRSVWDYLFNEGGLNTGAATNIVVEHHMSSGQQLAYFDSFMLKFGIQFRNKSIAGMQIPNVYMPLTAGTADQAATLITSVNGYKMISLKKTDSGAGGGHAVCAWYDGSDALFMDPNYGEFWFPSKVAMIKWFKYFWTKTYSKSYKSLRPRTYVAAA